MVTRRLGGRLSAKRKMNRRFPIRIDPRRRGPTWTGARAPGVRLAFGRSVGRSVDAVDDGHSGKLGGRLPAKRKMTRRFPIGIDPRRRGPTWTSARGPGVRLAVGRWTPSTMVTRRLGGRLPAKRKMTRRFPIKIRATASVILRGAPDAIL